MNAFLFYGRFVRRGEGDVWNDGPTEDGTILYSVITPIICVIGMVGNTLSILILCRKEFSGSLFTYLGVLSAADLCMSIAVFLSGLCRGALWYDGWVTYDALIGLPLCGAINSLSVWATVAVTVDRVVYLWNPLRNSRPKFCCSHIARRLMFVGFLLAVIFNIPYCFIFARMPDGTLVTTPFFDSSYYFIFNWIYLTIFAFIPALVIILGNGFLINSLQKAKRISRRCKKTNRTKKMHSASLTITLISITVMFLISEIPANLVSRTTAISILFNGNHDEANSTSMEVMREICTIISAMNLATNFICYYLFCPMFTRALFKMCKCRRRVCRSKTVQVNVFVLEGINFKKRTSRGINDKVKEKILEISRMKSLEGNAFAKDFVGRGDVRSDEKNADPFNTENEYIDLEAGCETHNYYTPPCSTIFEESETSYPSEEICVKDFQRY